MRSLPRLFPALSEAGAAELEHPPSSQQTNEQTDARAGYGASGLARCAIDTDQAVLATCALFLRKIDVHPRRAPRTLYSRKLNDMISPFIVLARLISVLPSCQTPSISRMKTCICYSIVIMNSERRGKVFSLVVLLVLVALILVAVLFWPKVDYKKLFRAAEVAQPGLYKVDHFNDGDTIAVDMNGSIETVRMIGIDTPETHRPDTPVQCYGVEASKFTKDLIGDSKVRLVADPINTNRDRYGRLLRYVYLPDGRLIEEELIKNGYAFSYTQFPFEKTEQFDQLEQTAQATGAGLWSKCSVTVEDNGREQTSYK